jgi:hypothetical protein
MEIKYVIFEIKEIGKINFDEVLTSSISTLRMANDNILTFVKWSGEDPSFISELKTKSIIYNTEEMLELMEGPNWKPIIDPYSGFTGITGI